MPRSCCCAGGLWLLAGSCWARRSSRRVSLARALCCCAAAQFFVSPLSAAASVIGCRALLPPQAADTRSNEAAAAPNTLVSIGLIWTVPALQIGAAAQGLIGFSAQLLPTLPSRDRRLFDVADKFDGTVVFVVITLRSCRLLGVVLKRCWPTAGGFVRKRPPSRFGARRFVDGEPAASGASASSTINRTRSWWVPVTCIQIPVRLTGSGWGSRQDRLVLYTPGATFERRPCFILQRCVHDPAVINTGRIEQPRIWIEFRSARLRTHQAIPNGDRRFEAPLPKDVRD